MFCPVCWKEYPKGMRHCDSCRAELIEEKPEGMKGHEHEEAPQEPSGQEKKKEPQK